MAKGLERRQGGKLVGKVLERRKDGRKMVGNSVGQETRWW
jgi:hypothetical protein